jgi:carboxylesterase
MTAPIIPGAEPETFPGGPHGALVLHGFTGNPVSMRGVAQALADAGFAGIMPLLPGHGTSVEDMATTRWSDWVAAVETAYLSLSTQVDGKIVVVGLSMGGALAADLTSRHPEIAGLVAINAVVSEPAGLREILDAMIGAGDEYMDAIGSDIADPEADEKAYDRTPLQPLVSLLEATGPLGDALGNIACPTLVITSRQDHTVEPSNSDVLAAGLGGPVDRVFLDNSFHVATLDHDKDEVISRTVAFARRVTAD